MRFFKETESETTRSGRRLSKKDVRERRQARRKKMAKIALGVALTGALAYRGYKTFKNKDYEKPPEINDKQLVVAKTLPVVVKPEPFHVMGKDLVAVNQPKTGVTLKTHTRVTSPKNLSILANQRTLKNKDYEKQLVEKISPDEVLPEPVDTLNKQLVVRDPKTVKDHVNQPVLDKLQSNPDGRQKTRSSPKASSWGTTLLEALYGVGTQIRGADTAIKKQVFQKLGQMSRQQYARHSKLTRAEEQDAIDAYKSLLKPTAFFEDKLSYENMLEATKHKLPQMLAQEAASLAEERNAYHAYQKMLEASKKFSPEDLHFYDHFGGRTRKRKAKRFLQNYSAL